MRKRGESVSLCFVQCMQGPILCHATRQGEWGLLSWITCGALELKKLFWSARTILSTFTTAGSLKTWACTV